MSTRAKLHEYRTFVSRALHRPGVVGAVLPTSRHVAAAVATVVPTTGAPVVVELGPGTGALSGEIDARLPERGRHLAVEIDPAMVRYLREAKPWLEVVEGDAARLRELLSATGAPKADAVISSIPWTLLPPAKQRELLREAAAALNTDGVFTTVTYLTTLWRATTREFVGALHETFDEVMPRSTVWRNLPPSRVYVCRRPRIEPGTAGEPTS
ncbi:methyltransferase domain-containing protein [Saccharopolyspora erythraea]|uniref:class I SAM-dependent methyltransferase n=1 Tax=Saccharopolyspora erythraea TaxID=1836 RepID=UPI001BAE19E5|nr:methyltransferase domain-containing protein [Saccharopolyspora erythraea]QUH05170.1 methyltransferase domain-containing protein [Saccharopolyspora erythraea]